MKYGMDRRSFLGLAGLAAGAAALSACGSSSSSSSSSTTTSSAAASGAASAGTITMWVDSNRLPVLQPVAAQFKQDHGVTVKLVVKDFGKIADDMIAQVPTGKGPDASLMPHDSIGRLVQNGVITPLQLADSSQFQDVAVKAFTYQGQIYGVPYAVENIALVRNTALAPSAPTSYDQMIQAGTSLKSSGKVKYAMLLGLDPKSGDPYHMYPFQCSFGAPVFQSNANGYVAKLAMGGAGGAAFAKWLSAQSKAKVFDPDITSDIAKDLFCKGQSAFYVTGQWNIDSIKKAGIKYAIDPVPKAGSQDATPFVGVQGVVMSARTSNSVATQKFLTEYLGTEKVQTALYKVGNRAPANKAAFAAASSNADVKAFGEVGAKGVPMPSLPAMSQVWTDWGQTEMTIISQKTSDPAGAWAQMCSAITSQIK